MAYWDIKGQLEKQPVCQLFGCKPKHKIPVYGTGLFYREVPSVKEQLPLLLQEMEGFVEQGYHGIKMKAGRYVAKEEAWLIGQIRQQLPSRMSLMVDANCGMRSMEETKDLMQRLEAIGVQWLEEPFAPNAYDKYEEACHARRKLEIAVGENEAELDGFRSLIKAGVTILQPELSLAGGFSKIPDLTTLAHEHQVQLTPHVWGSGVLYSATLNFYSMLSPQHTLPYERPFLTDPLRDDCFTHLSIKDGYISAPVKPGLGLEINDSEFQRYVAETA